MAGKRGKSSKPAEESSRHERATRQSSRNKNSNASSAQNPGTKIVERPANSKTPTQKPENKPPSHTQSPKMEKSSTSSKHKSSTEKSASSSKNPDLKFKKKQFSGTEECGSSEEDNRSHAHSSNGRKRNLGDSKSNNVRKSSKSDSVSKKVNSSKNEGQKTKIETVGNGPFESSVNVSNLDISSLLALGENMKQNEVSDNSDFDDVNSSESEDDWEEVSPENLNEMTNLEKKITEEEYKIPEEGVQITIAKDGVFRKKGKKGFDIQGFIRREINRNTRELYVDLHKVSLLCLLARGRMINNYLNSESNLAAGFSLLPTKQSCPPKHVDIGYLERFINWFRAAIKVNRYVLNAFEKPSPEEQKSLFESELMFQLEKKEAKDDENLVFVFILILRSCGMHVRLVCSLQPIPLKPTSDKLMKKPQEEDDDNLNDTTEFPCSSKSMNDSNDQTVNKSGASKNKKNTKNVNGKSNGKIKMDKKSPEKKKGRKMISSSEEEEETAKRGNDMWPEVYLEEEERWVSVDLVDGKFMCDNGLEAKATKKICYVVSFDNKNKIKDVTRRYDSHWLTGTQKLRVSDWWNETLKPFRGKRTAMDKMEDNFLDEHLLSQPFPKSIQEFKGHPLYALRRHLLKFESIYPPEPPPLGFIKNEAVFARECVRTLHSREIWLKQAKVVRMGEEPYKVVKSRPKYDKISGQLLASLPLDLFGEWQVEDYVPPTAENGIVPRNEYGNVELFLEKMLPKGTVHLQLTGLNRTAKKLGIDCAPALTGFEFHCGGSHPTYDGFVVCEEFKDILMDAWSEEQKEQEKKEREKRLKRIYDNWAKLLKGLLIREKLNKKYAFNLGGKRKNAEKASSAECDEDIADPGPSKKSRRK